MDAATAERIAKALESIADSLVCATNPPVIIGSGMFYPVPDLNAKPGEVTWMDRDGRNG